MATEDALEEIALDQSSAPNGAQDELPELATSDLPSAHGSTRDSASGSDRYLVPPAAEANGVDADDDLTAGHPSLSYGESSDVLEDLPLPPPPTKKKSSLFSTLLRASAVSQT
eukprot:4497553-Prymnesium_polylepis.1